MIAVLKISIVIKIYWYDKKKKTTILGALIENMKCKKNLMMRNKYPLTHWVQGNFKNQC